MLKLHGEQPEKRHIQHAVQVLADDKVVLVPTETGYCFVGKASSEKVFKKFLDLRQAHPKQKPFSLLCSQLSQVSEIAVMTTPVFRIAKKSLPGPYTFILDATRETPKFAGSQKRKSVGIRISGHPAASSLCEEFGEPLLITSVTDTQELESENYFENDEPSEDAWWVRAESIALHFKGRVDAAFCTPGAIALRSSTIVDFTVDPPLLVRDGGWPLETIGLAT